MDKKVKILSVLSEFYNVNLASESARNWLADEIIKKLDDENHQIQKPTNERKPGVFEEHMSNLDSTIERINGEMKKQVINGPEKIDEKPLSKTTKATKKSSVKKSTKSKSFRDIKKIRSDFIK